MSKTLYALSIPLAAYQFKKGDVDGFIVEIGDTNAFIHEAAFHKHFHPANTPAPEPIAILSDEVSTLPEGLDPALLEGKEEWQVRVIIECHELDHNIDRLNDFIKSDAFDELPEEQRELLLEQLGHMQEYHNVLLKRIGGFE